MAILELAGVKKAFGPVKVLSGVDLAVQPGEVHALIGPNGAGKSTLLHTVAGTLRADGGSVVFDGRELGGSDGIERARLGLSLQLQIPSVFGALRVLDNLHLAASAPGRARRATAGELEDVLDLVRLGALAEKPARDLSHGQLKWLELGLCLLTRPRLLLLDEPTAGMSQRERTETAELIGQLLGRGKVESIIVVEHDMGFVRTVCSTVSMLHRGAVLDTGDFETLAASHAAKEAYLGG